MTKYNVDVNKLKALTANKFRSIRDLCKASGVTEGSLYSTIKRNGSLQEGAILRLAKALETTPDSFSDMMLEQSPMSEYMEDVYFSEIFSIIARLNQEGKARAKEQLLLISMIPSLRKENDDD